MEIKLEKEKTYDINNEGLLLSALVDGEKVTCVATREVFWEDLGGDQVLSLQATSGVVQEWIQDVVRVLIAGGVQRFHGLEDLPQPVVVKHAHIVAV